MSEKKNLLVELFVEELPPKALEKLGNSFAQNVWHDLAQSGLASDSADLRHNVIAFASPRRLAVLVKDVLPQAPERQDLKRLMPVTVAFGADGKPTQALLKKLAALGFDDSVVPKLRRGSDGKGEVAALDTIVPGITLADGLQKALDYALSKLPIPKVMTYQLADGWSKVQFVRPAHGLVALHGDEVVPVAALGLQSGRETHGHRFEAAVDPIVLQDADSYAQQLAEQGAVIARFADRRGEIERQLLHAAAQQGLALVDDYKVKDGLLDEVTALVERPNVLLGHFDEAFLDVPQECLILTMKANQKYFPLLDSAGRLTNKFLIVSNIRPADASAVVGGNERVVRPRLADAKFFFDQDRRKTLESRVAGLAKVVYHGKLGSQGDRAERVGAIGHAIVNQLRAATLPYTVEAKDHFDVLDSKVRQAARLAKTDLLTDMVGEFPELQGVMGGYYARHDGLRDGVAIAIEDHYKPRFAGDALPRNHTGTVLALADKLETLVGLFGIGQLPTGDKDPFALRRHALGVIRILAETPVPVDLNALLQSVESTFGPLIVPNRAALVAFIEDRARYYFSARSAMDDATEYYLRGGLGVADADYRAFSPQQIDAVFALGWSMLSDVPKRLLAVAKFSHMPEAPALAAANKRVGNILKKADGAIEARVDAALLKEPAEGALAEALAAVAPAADAAFKRGDYTASLQALAVLKTPVDAFFDQVMVNADDPALRANRLGLLATLHAAMNRVADLSKLAA